uniref:Probable prefoldin subunit 6 n=1 Tax=Daphnia hispanica TaxID=575233 RepID=A0A4Y7M6I2_9CRUS|nr:EOG090X0MQF [Daphnia hispanica]
MRPANSVDPAGEVLPAPHYSYELPSEEEERFEKLFRQLDVNRDGRIDILELSQSLHKHGVPENLKESYATKFIQQSDLNQSGDVSLAEFIYYVREHEKKLQLLFTNLDTDKDGRIKVNELITAFRDLGVAISLQEAAQLIDKDGSLDIGFNEWRDFLLFHPTADLSEIINYWRHSTYLDVGECVAVPDDFTVQEMLSGMWWRHLMAGGMAGAVSRTSTAPLDRLKVFLQVHGLNKFGSLAACARHMLHEGGVRSLWRGNGINVMKIAPESAIKFMAYEKLKQYIKSGSPTRDLGMYERFVAGSIAGCISQTTIYPLELFRSFLPFAKLLKRMAEALQKKMQQEVEKFKAIQKEYQTVISSRQQLDSQLTENSGVKEELSLLESDANVFKLIGPVLVKQDLEEARQNVSKRIDYITGETKRLDKTIEDLDKKQDSQREALGKLQQQLQQAQVKAAMKA